MNRATRSRPASFSIEEFVAQAVMMEIEASERYAELADTMEVHNSPEVAALFRKLSVVERLHADRMMADMGWSQLPELAIGDFGWNGFDAPEMAPIDSVHYLMRPYHVLQIALANEKRAEQFFGALAEAAANDAVRRAALKLQAEEREHIAWIRESLEHTPRPEPDWNVDPDPPRFVD
ncbi:MAG TPA: ferritin family protein [Burkholderiaceae bacterium]|jgi:rubrerythrin|nr:ferritin family protein [Burkholderiaceae bacterium]